jgi:YjjG family noncanonical pyrimidine nucleotidase
LKYKWLLFDADGTLFDYDRAEAVALQRTFEQADHRFESRYGAVYRQINAEIWRQFERGEISQDRLRMRRFEMLFDEIDVDLKAGPFSSRYLGNLAQGIYLIDGAQQVIEALHGRIGLLLITNGLQDVQRPRLARSSLAPYFHEMVISEEVGWAKPAAGIFDVAFSRMRRPEKEEVLIVGDSLTSDIQGGANYGIDTCWFNPQGRPRSLDVEIRYEIRDLRELLPLVDGVSRDENDSNH